MKFLGLLFLASCAAQTATVPSEYMAAMDVGCFLYALDNAPDVASRKLIADRCFEGMKVVYHHSQSTKEHMR